MIRRLIAAVAIFTSLFALAPVVANAETKPGMDKRQWICPYLMTDGRKQVLFCIPLPFNLPH